MILSVTWWLKQIVIGVAIIPMVWSLRIVTCAALSRSVSKVFGFHKSGGKKQGYVGLSAKILDQISKQLLAKILLFVYEIGSNQKRRRHCNVYVIHLNHLISLLSSYAILVDTKFLMNHLRNTILRSISKI